MQLTVLGSSAAYPGPGSACSGCLVEEGRTKLLLDCGTGVLSNLQRVVELKDVNYIVISHLHADHCFDLIPYRHALTRPQHKDLHPYLYLPPGGGEMLLKLVSAFDALSTFFSDFFFVKEYDPTATLRLGDLSIEFASVKHYVQDYAIAVSGSKRIVYSADSGLCEELEVLARDADLFLCEATKCDHRDADWGHLSADEVGMLSKKARVKRLMLTHFWPDCDYSPNIRQAEAAFGRAVEVAKELCTYRL
jgi:ribonuclease BN (tRNA processing enzyme)